ncbi:MAG: SPFH domain-containing protein [Verrucomicrobiota bacterium]|nr:SPFH domain-containing protein [Verrucomicrobiota bacterium]
MNKILTTISIVAIIAIIAFWSLIGITTTYIPVGKAGVRTRVYGIIFEKGIIKKDFGPGWHIKLGPFDSWKFFDTTVQTLEMTRDPVQGDRRGRDDIQVQSSDGYTISVDVTVKYRIQEGKAHKVYVDTGSGSGFKTIVRNESHKVCMNYFGEMKTEEFYDPAIRRVKTKEILKHLGTSLEDNSIEIIEVLIRNVEFDAEYEKQIQNKKLADQEVELNKSLARAETMSGKTQVIEAETRKKLKIIKQELNSEIITLRAETEKNCETIKAEAEKYATEKEADADLLAAEKEAKGNLLVKKAEAEGEKLRNKALAGDGGDIIVALEAAKNLNISEATFSTMNIDLFDINEMAEKLGAKDN